MQAERVSQVSPLTGQPKGWSFLSLLIKKCQDELEECFMTLAEDFQEARNS